MTEVKVKIYDKCKYDRESKKIDEIIYNIEGFKVISGGRDAELIEMNLDAESVDEFHEYLVLALGDGKFATFRNSHVDMFRW